MSHHFRWGLAVLLLATTVMAAAFPTAPLSSAAALPKKPIVVGIIGPLSAMLRAIGGDHVTVVTLVPPGASPHVFEPAPHRVRQLRQAKLVVSIGSLGLSVASRPHLTRLVPNTYLIMADEVVYHDPLVSSPGLRASPRHHHDDTHFWTSLRTMSQLIPALVNGLSAIDPAHAKAYQTRGQTLKEAFQAHDRVLSRRFKRGQAFVIYHPSLGFFARDYGLIQLPIEVHGRSPSPVELQRLMTQVRSHPVRTILISPSTSPGLVQRLAAQWGAQVAVFDPYAESYPQNLMALQL